MLRIKTPSGVTEPFVRQRVTLSGREYFFIFKYVRRYNYLTLSIYTSAGQTVALNVTMRTGTNFLRKARSKTLSPPGSLFLYCSEKDFVTPTLEMFGDERVRLYYLEPGEV